MAKKNKIRDIVAITEIDEGPFHIRCTDARQSNLSHAQADTAIAECARRNARELIVGVDADAVWLVCVSVEKDTSRKGWREAILAK